MVKRREVAHFGGVTTDDPAPAAGPVEATETTPPPPIADMTPPSAPILDGAPCPETAAQVEALEAERRRLVERINITIPTAIENARARLAEAQTTLGAVADRVNNKREERQHLLAAGVAVESLNREIEEIRNEKEMAEDLVKGLETLIPALERESLHIQTEGLPRVQRQLFDLKVTPLVVAYNATAARLAELTEALHRLASDHVQSLYGNASVWPSSREAFDTVARLNRVGDVGDDFFKFSQFAWRVQQQMKAAEQA